MYVLSPRKFVYPYLSRRFRYVSRLRRLLG